MTYRIFKHNGQVTDRIDTYEENRHLSPDETAAAEVATALGVDVSTVTVEHVDEAPTAEVTIPAQVLAADQPTANDLLAGKLESLSVELEGLGDAVEASDTATAKVKAYGAAEKAREMAAVLKLG